MRPSKVTSTRRQERETAVWTLSCDMCGQTFADQTSLDRHLAAEHETAVCALLQEASHACPFCTETFKTGMALFEHRASCHGDIVVSGLGISNPDAQVISSDESAELRTSPQNAVQCSLCCEFFRDQHDLQQHNLDWHEHAPQNTITNTANIVTCPFCPSKVPETDLKSHVVNRHAHISRTCPHCGKILAVSALVTHVETCEGVKTARLEAVCRKHPYKVVLWGKSYDEYLNHMYSHGKPYTCTVCNSRSLTDQRLKAHLFIHQLFSLDPSITKPPAREIEIQTRARPENSSEWITPRSNLPSATLPSLKDSSSETNDDVIICKLCRKSVKCDFPSALKLHFGFVHSMENMDDVTLQQYVINHSDDVDGRNLFTSRHESRECGVNPRDAIVESGSHRSRLLVTCPFCPTEVPETDLKSHVVNQHARICRSCPNCCRILTVSVLVTHVETCMVKTPKAVPACRIPGCGEVMWGKSHGEYLSHVNAHGAYSCTVCHTSSIYSGDNEEQLKAHLLIHQPFSLYQNLPKYPAQDAFVTVQNEEHRSLGPASTSGHEAGKSESFSNSEPRADGADRRNSSADTFLAFSRTLTQKMRSSMSQHKCYYCPHEFTSRDDLLRHSRTLHKDFGSYCPHCDMKFKSRTFKRHQTLCQVRLGGADGLNPLQPAHQAGILTCRLCTEYLPIANTNKLGRYGISAHMRYHMGHLPQTQVMCPLCPQTYQDFVALQRHLQHARCHEHVEPRPQKQTSTFSEHVSKIIDQVVADSLNADNCTSEPSQAPQSIASTRRPKKKALLVQPSSVTKHLDTGSKLHSANLLPTPTPSLFNTPIPRTSAESSSSVQYSSNLSAMPSSPSVELRSFQQPVQPSDDQLALPGTSGDGAFAGMMPAEDLAEQFNASKQSSNISFRANNAPALIEPTPIWPEIPEGSPCQPWHIPVTQTSQPTRHDTTTTENETIDLTSDEDSGKAMTCLFCQFTSDHAYAVRKHFFRYHSHDNYRLLNEHLVQQEQNNRKGEQDAIPLSASSFVPLNQDPIIACETADRASTNDTYERRAGPCDSFATEVNPRPGPSTTSRPHASMYSSGSFSTSFCTASNRSQHSVNAPTENDREDVIQCLYCDFISELSLSIRSHYFHRHYDGGPKGIEEYARLNRYLVVQDQRLEKIKKQRQELEAVKEKLDEQQRLFKERLEEQNRIVQQKLDQFDKQMQIATVSSTIPEERSRPRSSTCVAEIALNPEPLTPNCANEETISDLETSVRGMKGLDPSRPSPTFETAKVRCRLCSATFDNNKSFVKHVMKEHPNHLSYQKNGSQKNRRSVLEDSDSSSCKIDELHPKKKSKCDRKVLEVVDDTPATLKLLLGKWKLKECSVRLVDCQKTSFHQTFSARKGDMSSESSRRKSLGRPGVHNESFGSRTPERGHVEDYISDYDSEKDDSTQCPLCEKVLTTEIRTKDHIVSKHSRTLTGDQYVVQCPGCDFSSAVYKITYEHILKEHEADEEALAELAEERNGQQYTEIVKMAYEVGKKAKKSNKAKVGLCQS